SVEDQFMSITAHPAFLYRWIPKNQCITINTFCNNCSRPNKSIFSNFIAANNSSIGPNRYTFPDKGLPVFRFPFNKAPWVYHIGKHHARPEEYIVFYDNPGV